MGIRRTCNYHTLIKKAKQLMANIGTATTWQQWQAFQWMRDQVKAWMTIPPGHWPFKTLTVHPLTKSMNRTHLPSTPVTWLHQLVPLVNDNLILCNYSSMEKYTFFSPSVWYHHEICSFGVYSKSLFERCFVWWWMTLGNRFSNNNNLRLSAS